MSRSNRARGSRMTKPCLFCRIVAGEVPAEVVFEDEQGIAFLDHAPVFPGHCLLVPREVFGAIGVMDAAYFMYYDDTDFIVRARRAGFRCVLNPAARLRHYERGATGPVSLSPISVYYSSRNRPYFMGKHAPSWPRYAVFLLYFSVTRAANLLKWIATGDFQRPAWMLRGLVDFARGRMGPMNGTVAHGSGTGA